MNNSNNNSSPLEEYQDYWDIIDKTLNEGTNSGYKMAIIETEKILLLSLNKKKIPGKNIEEKIKNVRKLIKNPDKLNYAHTMYEKITKEPGFNISSEDTREIVAGYYKTISDIENIDLQDLPIKEKMNFLLHGNFEKYQKNIKRLFIIIFLFFLLVFLLSETTTGNLISEQITSFSQYLFYKVFLTFLKIGIGITLIFSVWHIWKRRKRKH
ncbi:MAG: hypothetical protein P1P85_01760 [Patescibacteria group bacterium]|nr:hypothetical protein [Patescibacteria group bacterium]